MDTLHEVSGPHRLGVPLPDDAAAWRDAVFPAAVWACFWLAGCLCALWSPAVDGGIAIAGAPASRLCDAVHAPPATAEPSLRRRGGTVTCGATQALRVAISVERVMDEGAGRADR